MKLKIFFCVAVLTSMALTTFTSCDTEAEALEIQRLTTYDDQYYENLRKFKATDHQISYVYYAEWAPIEGATGYKDPASYGERLIGLPDSLDICNLWMGIPTPESHPVAYADMLECQQKKGTRFVFHADASHYGQQFWYRDENFNIDKNRVITLHSGNEEELRAYARWAVDTVVTCGLDGVDFDYEGWNSADMLVVANECHKFFGPEGKWAEKLFIVDYFGSSPSAEIDQYCDYLVKQAYSGQGAGVGAGGHDDAKTVYCESFGQNPGGGQIEYYAVWQPGNGKRKGGCGGFYVERNYNRVTQHKYNIDGTPDSSSDNIPYSALRRAIQIMNPALHK